MTDEEERLYRQLEAMIAAMVADDQVEAIYSQLSNLGR
jgi:dsRNA-specific ribonuclease